MEFTGWPGATHPVAFARGTWTRLTVGSTTDWDPTWTPDGKEVVFWEGSTWALSWMVFWAKPSAQAQDVWALYDWTGSFLEPR